MYIVIGNKTKEMPLEEVQTLLKSFADINIDLGTGDGRYVYKNGLKNPEILYIGVDPAEKQLQKYSRKVIRKKMDNVLFVVGSAENLPTELEKAADIVNILLPWGSLLNYVANCNLEVMEGIKKLLKPAGKLNLLFGYAERSEPTETERLDLEKLDEEYLKKVLIPSYEKLGLLCTHFEGLSFDKLREFETSWSKKLSFGKDRPMFFMVFQLKTSKF
jgi:16S rRNA (adenine(1408)-N(1))-methyltransferase